MENNTEMPATPGTTPATGGATAATPQAQPQKGKSKKGLAIAAVVAAIVVVIGAGIAFFVASSNKEQSEEMAYAVLENNDNPQDYRDFLANFPESEHAAEVRTRLAKLEEMMQAWNNIALSDNAQDFIKFKATYSDAQYGRLCDIKIDSLDWITAQNAGTQEAFQRYLDAHPDGRYASEASVSQGNLKSQEVSAEETAEVNSVCSDFFSAFEKRDEAAICSNITATMTQFLNKSKATKADVVNIIKGMFNEHIESCQFVVNRDMEVTRKTDAQGNSVFCATFTVDQHIQRDNEGKTFGSYKAVATVTAQYLISSLTLTEVSKQ